MGRGRNALEAHPEAADDIIRARRLERRWGKAMRAVAEYLRRLEAAADVDVDDDAWRSTDGLAAAADERRAKLEAQAQEVSRLLNFAGHHRALLTDALEGEEAP